ncbi:hypothetical protein GCM10011487_16230 [Steroidobacter agaridevorans]|uniref:Porin domain-containing protein n=1 Tax=Steroidobacter agaridevorans TaxID=2695856 RepID=A0A829Y9E5_9GAMM|nr:hypothetical protein [Steroidobacter agaridevorans]GFE79623.1 hypothetical protein GCM10011487_16230 [Steroidobacter agaridevorans]
MSSRFSIVALAVAAALPTVASAVDFSYSGFSTAAYSQSDTNLADVGYTSQPDSIDKGGSFETDSKLGVQLTAKFNDIISATVQGVAYTDLTGDFEPHLDWAYVRAQATQSLSFRGGYLRAPTFMYSDSVFVGYANTWVRPPLEVYNLSPVYQLLGVDATYRAQLGAFTVTVNPYFGESEVDVSTLKLDVPEWKGLATTVNVGSFQARVGYGVIDLETDSNSVAALTDPLFAVPAALCGSCASEAQKLLIGGARIANLNVGVQYDDGTNLIASEYAKSDADGGEYFMPDRYSAYVTYGRRFGNLMPYATLAGTRRETPLSTNAISIPALSAAVNGVIASQGATDQDSYSLGVRYELPSFSVVKGALVKFQYDHIDADGRGNLNNVQPGFDGKIDMVSASLDFIF